MGLFSLVKRRLKGSINEYKCTLGNDVEGARLSSEAPIERTRGKGYKLKLESPSKHKKKNTVKAAKHGNRFHSQSVEIFKVWLGILIWVTWLEQGC